MKKIMITGITLLLIGITVFSIFKVKSIGNRKLSLATNTTEVVPEITFKIAHKRTVSEDLSSYGSVNYFKKVNVTARLEEVLVKNYVDMSDMVSKGELLAILRDDYIKLSYESAQEELKNKQAAFQMAQAKYQNSLLSVEKALQSLERLKLDEKEKKIELKNTARVLSNKNELLAFGGITKEKIRELQNNYEITKIKYESVVKQRKAAEIGYRNQDILTFGYKVPKNYKDRLAILKEIHTRVEKAQLNIAHSEMKKAEISLESAKMNLKETRIKSPLSGIVAAKYVEPGEKVGKDKPLFTILDLSKVYVELPVPETQISMIHEKQKIKLRLDAHPNRVFTGEIDRIYPMVDAKTRTFTVRCLIKNRKVGKRKYLLMPGMFVRAKIITETRKDVMTIPFSAMAEKEKDRIKIFLIKRQKGKKNFALVVEKWVPIVKILDDYIEVAQGVKDGDFIATSGLDFLETGMKVQLSDKEEGNNEEK